jgi:hypothetical protein
MSGHRARFARSAIFLAALVALFSAATRGTPPGTKEKPSTAKPKAEADTDNFIRLVRDDKKTPRSMDTAIVTYVPADDAHPGLTVDLIGAVHVGEREYYDQLNSEFEKYDALLYELVAPDDDNVPKAGRGTSNAHPIGLLQNSMKDMLELDHQLSRVKYDRPNFVHADMSPTEFAETMASRDESLTKMFFRMMGQGIAQQSKQQARNGRTAEADMMAALFSKERAVMLKRVMAEQFGDLESAMAGLDGPEGSTIITERNKVALEVLQEQIDAGKKKIGIFYGAGHLKDMEERLLKDFKLKRGETRWITAWDLRTKKQKERDSKAEKGKE